MVFLQNLCLGLITKGTMENKAVPETTTRSSYSAGLKTLNCICIFVWWKYRLHWSGKTILPSPAPSSRASRLSSSSRERSFCLLASRLPLSSLTQLQASPLCPLPCPPSCLPSQTFPLLSPSSSDSRQRDTLGLKRLVIPWGYGFIFLKWKPCCGKYLEHFLMLIFFIFSDIEQFFFWCRDFLFLILWKRPLLGHLVLYTALV